MLLRGLIFIVFLSTGWDKVTAQQQSPHSIRNTKTNDNSGNSGAVGTTTTVKTLSVVPGITPRENVISRDDGRSNSLNNNNTANPNNKNRVNSGTNNTTLNNNTSTNFRPDNYHNADLGTGNQQAANNNNAGKVLLSNSATKLTSFTGRSLNGEYQLAWETVLENDIQQYDVEYSLNNVDFQTAGTVSASDKAVYTFNHTVDASHIAYYRLKVVDKQGSYAYTSHLTIPSNLARPADFVAPTIIRDNVLNISLTNAYKDVRLINNAGVEVYREYVGGRTGNRIGFNLPDLPAGPYFVRLIGENGAITQRVIIM